MIRRYPSAAFRRKTAKASPKNKGLIGKRGKKGALAAMAAYLIREIHARKLTRT